MGTVKFTGWPWIEINWALNCREGRRVIERAVSLGLQKRTETVVACQCKGSGQGCRGWNVTLEVQRRRLAGDRGAGVGAMGD